jgi:osmotically-inducible protein OsmY
MDTASKLRLARKGVEGIAGTSYAAGKLVGTAKTSGRAAQRGAKASGFGLKQVGTGARRAAERAPQFRHELTSPQTRKLPVVAGVAAGAAGAYFLDPEHGKRRRHIARDKAMKLVRRGSAEAQRKAQYASGKAVGAVQERRPSPRDPERDLNDPALARKVESEIFRSENAPKDKVSVNVEEGVVFLRGEVATPGQASALAQAARRVDGVKDVQSLLHLPSEPAKSKDGQPKAAT